SASAKSSKVKTRRSCGMPSSSTISHSGTSCLSSSCSSGVTVGAPTRHTSHFSAVSSAIDFLLCSEHGFPSIAPEPPDAGSGPQDDEGDTPSERHRGEAGEAPGEGPFTHDRGDAELEQHVRK